jgi:hypothetical protein
MFAIRCGDPVAMWSIARVWFARVVCRVRVPPITSCLSRVPLAVSLQCIGSASHIVLASVVQGLGLSIASRSAWVLGALGPG